MADTPNTEAVADPIDKELADIATARKTDKRAYFKNEEMQARERELLDMRATRPKEAPTVSGLEDLDAEYVARYRSMLANGTFAPEELQRVYGLTDAEVEGLQTPAAKGPTKQSIEEELAAIAQRRRTDRPGYNKDAAMQARERHLLEARARLNAPDDKGEGAELVPTNGSALDPLLLQEWAKEGGVAHSLGAAQTAARTAIDALQGDEGQALMAGFDGLPASAQTQVIRFLAIPGGTWKGADDAAIQQFASDEAGAQLVKDWRSRASRNVAVVEGRRRVILDGMSPDDRKATEVWFAGLPAKQKRAVMLSLLR